MHLYYVFAKSMHHGNHAPVTYKSPASMETGTNVPSSKLLKLWHNADWYENTKEAPRGTK
jgi:hypothetical protein